MGIVYIASQTGKPKPRFAAIRTCDGWKYTEEQVRDMEKNACPNSVACKSMGNPEDIPELGRSAYRNGKKKKPRVAYNRNMVVPGDFKKTL